MSFDFAPLMRQVAPLLGFDPTQANRKQIARYRSRGSLRVDFDQGLFADYEAGVSGGVLAFIEHFTGEEPRAWLQRQSLPCPVPGMRTYRKKPPDTGALPREFTEDEQKRAEIARRIWRDARPIDGVPEVADYLVARGGLDVAGLENELRFHPKTPWRPEDMPLQWRKCLLVAYRNLETDELTGFSRILLDEPQAWPSTKRMMLGVVRCAAAKLADVVDELAIAEGTETCVAANMLGLGPAWSVGSAGAVANLPVLAGIRHLILLREADDVSRKATARCAARWLRAGRDVTYVDPDVGKDLNDELMVGR
jgi:putative DNA primase/helicase